MPVPRQRQLGHGIDEGLVHDQQAAIEGQKLVGPPGAAVGIVRVGHDQHTRRLRLRHPAHPVAGGLPGRRMFAIGRRDDRDIAGRHAVRQMEDCRLRARHRQRPPCPERPRRDCGKIGDFLFGRQPRQGFRRQGRCGPGPGIDAGREVDPPALRLAKGSAGMPKIAPVLQSHAAASARSTKSSRSWPQKISPPTT